MAVVEAPVQDVTTTQPSRPAAGNGHTPQPKAQPIKLSLRTTKLGEAYPRSHHLRLRR